METSSAILELNKITKQRNLCVIVAFVLLVVSLLQVLIIFRQEKSVILVPSFFNGDLNLSNKKVSISYLENISRDVVGTMLDITPDNANYASEQILKITHPRFYGELKQQLLTRAQDVIARKITTNFYPKSMIADVAKNQIYVSGKLMTFLGSKMVLEEEKTYSITYEYNNFQLLIADFHEEDLKKKEDVKNEN